MTTEHSTETAAAVEAVRDAELVQRLDVGPHRVAVTHPASTRVVVFNEELAVAEAPHRARGERRVHSVDSFLTATAMLTDDPFTVYANEPTRTVVAVLNDDTVNGPGWRDHRVMLGIDTTPEWQAWSNGQGLGGQDRFALRIEEGAVEIVDPAAAVMLEMAQTFTATTHARFKSASRLKDGQSRLGYEEDIEASAGTGDTVQIPDLFTLNVRPFLGASKWKVDARIRYKIPRGGGDLEIGYSLVRPDDIVSVAFAEVVDQIREAAPDSAVFISGAAPGPGEPSQVQIVSATG